VRNVLHKDSKWEKAKRIGRGVWTFVKTPMGAFTAIYGFCVAFWGAAIVLFLLGSKPVAVTKKLFGLVGMKSVQQEDDN